MRTAADVTCHFELDERLAAQGGQATIALRKAGTCPVCERGKSNGELGMTGFVPILAVPTADPAIPKTRFVVMNERPKLGSASGSLNGGKWVAVTVRTPIEFQSKTGRWLHQLNDSTVARPCWVSPSKAAASAHLTEEQSSRRRPVRHLGV